MSVCRVCASGLYEKLEAQNADLKRLTVDKIHTYIQGTGADTEVWGKDIVQWLIDEHAALNNATEILKGYRARGAAICLEGAGCSNYTDELIAYANTLEKGEVMMKENLSTQGEGIFCKVIYGTSRIEYVDVTEEVADMEVGIKKALEFLGRISEDCPTEDGWAGVNRNIQEAHDILDNAKGD